MTKIEASEVMINGVAYVPKADTQAAAARLDGLPYVICRTFCAGVFAGYLESRLGQEAVLRRARRIWRWFGAASLSQLSVDGTSKPKECKFPCEVESVTLTQVVEILPVTAKAQKSIAEVPVWTA